MMTEVDLHTRFVETPNLYRKVDMGTLPVWYPDGCIRWVGATWVLDTAGIAFYSFSPDTPLS